MEHQKKKIPRWLKVVGVIFVIGIIIGVFNDESEDFEKKTKLDSNTKVTMKDLSNMSVEEITNWCEEKKLNCYKKEEYSDNISVGEFIKQSVNDGEVISEGETVEVIYSLGTEPTAGQKNALRSAKSYLDYSAFSYEGLIKQLEYEKFSYKDAKYAADNCGADWMEQAYKSGKSYLDYSSFSLNSLISQLEYEKFTKEQAKYGAEKAYNEQ